MTSIWGPSHKRYLSCQSKILTSKLIIQNSIQISRQPKSYTINISSYWVATSNYKYIQRSLELNIQTNSTRWSRTKEQLYFTPQLHIITTSNYPHFVLNSSPNCTLLQHNKTKTTLLSSCRLHFQIHLFDWKCVLVKFICNLFQGVQLTQGWF